MVLCLLSPEIVSVGYRRFARKKPPPEISPETTVSRGTTLVAGRICRPLLPVTQALRSLLLRFKGTSPGRASPNRLPPHFHSVAARCWTLSGFSSVPRFLWDELYHGKTALSKTFSFRPHILEACPRKRAGLSAKICKSDKASRESVGQKAEARGPNRETIGAEVMIPALIPSFRIVRRGRFASGLTGSTGGRRCPGKYRPGAAAQRWGRWCSPPAARPR